MPRMTDLTKEVRIKTVRLKVRLNRALSFTLLFLKQQLDCNRNKTWNQLDKVKVLCWINQTSSMRKLLPLLSGPSISNLTLFFMHNSSSNFKWDYALKKSTRAWVSDARWSKEYWTRGTSSQFTIVNFLDIGWISWRKRILWSNIYRAYHACMDLVLRQSVFLSLA